MDHSYTRQSKLIKAINLAVWAVLFLAGITLCQRVYSERQDARQALAVANAGDVAAADHASAAAEDLGNDSEASSSIDNDEQLTNEPEVETVKEKVAETVVEEEKPKVASTKPTIPHFKPPPRRKTRQTKTTPKKTVKPKSIDIVDTAKTTASKPAVLATSPITSHTSDDAIASKDKDLPKELGLDEITPSTPKITKSLSSQPSIADTATKMPRRVPKTTKRESTTTAQSSISLTPPSTKASNKAKVKEVAKAKELSATQKTASKPASQKIETKTVKAEPKKAKTRVEKTTPKRNPLQLVIENPKKIGYPVSFLIGDEQKTLQPGEKLERILSTRGSTANVHFDRGGDFGEAILNLKPAVYEFKVTREGWNIVPQKTE